MYALYFSAECNKRVKTMYEMFQCCHQYLIFSKFKPVLIMLTFVVTSVDGSWNV